MPRLLIRLGLVATTVPMGAKHRREQYTTTLTGTPVVVWPDNDTAGQARIPLIQRALAGKARTLTILQIPAPSATCERPVPGATCADLDALVQQTAP